MNLNLINSLINDKNGIFNLFQDILNIEDVMKQDNSNKDSRIIGTQKDLVYGVISKYIAMKDIELQNQEIIQAANDKYLKLHDLDNYLSKTHNCTVMNISDMLLNGYYINKLQVLPFYELPKEQQTFQNACTQIGKIMSSAQGNQFGAISVTLCQNFTLTNILENQIKLRAGFLKTIAEGVHNLFYQIVTNYSQGQSGFQTIYLTNYKHPLNELIYNEIFKQKQQYFKFNNFPKIILEIESEDQINDLILDCIQNTMQPEITSKKILLQRYPQNKNEIKITGCRTFFKDKIHENENETFDVRFNICVCTLNLSIIPYELLDKYLELSKEYLLIRKNRFCELYAYNNPICFQHGGVSRLNPEDSLKNIINQGTISIGFVGLWDQFERQRQTKSSQSQSQGEDQDPFTEIDYQYQYKEFAEKFLKKIRTFCNDNDITFYSSPSETTIQTHYVSEPKVHCTEPKVQSPEPKVQSPVGYLTNSFHINVKQNIPFYRKMQIEGYLSQYPDAGNIVYCELENISNLQLKQIITYGLDYCQYFEINKTFSKCLTCNQQDCIVLSKDLQFYCKNCDERNYDKISVLKRICGFISQYSQSVNDGKKQEFLDRKQHTNIALSNQLILADTVNHKEINTSAIFSGCGLKCKNCHNEWLQTFNKEFNDSVINNLQKHISMDNITDQFKVVIIGGDIMYYQNEKYLKKLYEIIKKNLFIYSGYTNEALLQEEIKYGVEYYLNPYNETAKLKGQQWKQLFMANSKGVLELIITEEH